MGCISWKITFLLTISNPLLFVHAAPTETEAVSPKTVEVLEFDNTGREPPDSSSEAEPNRERFWFLPFNLFRAPTTTPPPPLPPSPIIIFTNPCSYPIPGASPPPQGSLCSLPSRPHPPPPPPPPPSQSTTAHLPRPPPPSTTTTTPCPPPPPPTTTPCPPSLPPPTPPPPRPPIPSPKPPTTPPFLPCSLHKNFLQSLAEHQKLHETSSSQSTPLPTVTVDDDNSQSEDGQFAYEIQVLGKFQAQPSFSSKKKPFDGKKVSEQGNKRPLPLKGSHYVKKYGDGREENDGITVSEDSITMGTDGFEYGSVSSGHNTDVRTTASTKEEIDVNKNGVDNYNDVFDWSGKEDDISFLNSDGDKIRKEKIA